MSSSKLPQLGLASAGAAVFAAQYVGLLAIAAASAVAIFAYIKKRA